MDRHNLVAVFNSRHDAERAVDELLKFGIPAENIRLSPAGAELGGAASAATPTGGLPQERHGSFWDWLFGNDVPERDRSWYQANLRDGRTALSVLVRDVSQHEGASDIIDRFNPIDIDDETAPATPMREPGVGVSHDVDREIASEGEQVIPVVKEELAVGKRASERRYRVRTYVTETPVEEQVRLRDERVVVEHRPVTGDVTGNAGDIREREFEVVERHEEPVIEKRARTVEEVVVRREADERVETVRDTVRETKVDVDKERVAENRADVERPVSPNPNRRS